MVHHPRPARRRRQPLTMLGTVYVTGDVANRPRATLREVLAAGTTCLGRPLCPPHLTRKATPALTRVPVGMSKVHEAGDR